MSSWISLHSHTDYSLLDGAARIGDLINQAVNLNMSAVAITDHGNMYGAIPFYKAAKKAGIKPIIGCELYVAERSRFDKDAQIDRPNYHLTVLAKDNEGYRNLIKLVTAAQLEGFYYKPRVDHELLEKYNKGLIVLSGCLGGELADGVIAGGRSVDKTYDFYKQVFGDRYYLEIQDHGIEEQKLLNHQLELLDKNRLVATNDLHYVNVEDAQWHEAFLCMQTGSKLSDEKRFRFHGPEFYLKPHLLLPENAMRRTLDIADQCNVELDLGHYTLPPFPIPHRKTALQYLEEIAFDGLQTKYSSITIDLLKRFNEEMSVIQQTHFETYFLIVWDIYKFAHENNILAGPGRGSAAGSLIAYSLGITDVDPIKYGLMFERFLNKDRVSMPDVDCDFSINGREKIINYVREKYGNVAQIITFSTLQSKAAIRDTARVLGVELKEADRLSKLVPTQYGRNRSIKECRETIPEFVTDGQLLDIAEKLEGLIKGIGTHAAGVVIAPDDIQNYTPLQYSPNKETIITQYDMDALQEVGLLKMDFLGLENLDIIETCIQLIGHNVDFIDNDKTTFELLSSGLTAGVFQLGSDGMKGMLKELKPSQFSDIVAAVALWRPGPMQYLGSYINRKHGREEVEYLHPLLKDVLDETYGLLIYQEQTMKAAQLLAGFSLAKADILRAAMGKKDKEKMAALKNEFITGCMYKEDGSGLSEQQANKIFEQIEKFSDYAFNASHATAYAITAYRTAYLKAHYPLEYMCALLTHAKDLIEVNELARECRNMGIEILPPDINKSQVGFIVEDGKIRFGLLTIKNIGKQVAEIIVAGQPYRSRKELCQTLKEYKTINVRVIESLVNAGTLDKIMERNAALYNLDGVFGGEVDNSLSEIPMMSQEELLRREKEYLGIYLTYHPLDNIKNSKDVIKDFINNQKVDIIAHLTSVKKIETRNKKQMAYLQIEDMTGQCEAVIFPSVFEKFRHLLNVGNVLKIYGSIESDREDRGYQVLVRSMEAI